MRDNKFEWIETNVGRGRGKKNVIQNGRFIEELFMKSIVDYSRTVLLRAIDIS